MQRQERWRHHLRRCVQQISWDFFVTVGCVAFHVVSPNEGFDPPRLHHPKFQPNRCGLSRGRGLFRGDRLLAPLEQIRLLLQILGHAQP